MTRPGPGVRAIDLGVTVTPGDLPLGTQVELGASELALPDNLNNVCGNGTKIELQILMISPNMQTFQFPIQNLQKIASIVMVHQEGDSVFV